MQCKVHSQVVNLFPKLFVPSVRIFSSSETVPFHISLCSSASFLNSIAGHVTESDICLERPIHVFLLRRTTVLIGRWTNVQEEVLGIARVFPNPITAIEPLSGDTATLSWDGEIDCERPIGYPGFTTSVVEVRVSLVYLFRNLGVRTPCISGFLGAFIARPPWSIEIHSSATLSGVSYSSGHTPLDRQILNIPLHHLFKRLNKAIQLFVRYSMFIR